MKWLDFSVIGEKVLFDKLENGLEVYIIRKKDFNTETARFFTNFGGKDIEFIPYGEKEYKKVPAGIAHFLEHKLFEQKDGEPAEEFFKKSGSYVNAFTNYSTTCYYFVSTKNFENNLNYLLDFVQSPFFTEKNVEKERGIIIEEAKSYLDNPNRVFNEQIMSNLFNEVPYYNKVVGSIDDIKSIKKEDIYVCYNTFYHPSNMKLLVVTNKKEEDILNLIKENQKQKIFSKPFNIKRKKYNEPLKVKKEYDVLNYNVNEKRICYAFKMDFKMFKEEKAKVIDSIGIYLDYLIGDLSEFNLKLKKEKIITSNISISINVLSGIVIVKIYSFVNDEEKFIKLLDDKLNTKEKIEEKDFSLLKKAIISSLYYKLDNVSGIMNFFYDEYSCYKEINQKNILLEKNLSYEDFNKIVNKINIDNKSITIMKRSKNE